MYYITLLSLVIVAWLARPETVAYSRVVSVSKRYLCTRTRLNSLNGGFLTVTLPTGPEVFAGLEVGHTVGPMLWGWELDVTVHSTCSNARMGG
jgi:hypothetical protein